jgi:hypothetical protein
MRAALAGAVEMEADLWTSPVGQEGARVVAV